MTLSVTDYNHPFLDERYALSYSASVLLNAELPIPLIERSIDGTRYSDAQLPWPYVDLNVGDLERLAQKYPHIVSLVGVLLSSRDRGYEKHEDLSPLKLHYIFDPSRDQTSLSAKSRSNLTVARQIWQFRRSSTVDDWMIFQELYRILVARRLLSGSSYDFPSSHFERLTGVPSIELIGVHDGTQWGAMICVMQYRLEMHMLHLVVSDSGMKTNATYLLMQSLIDNCRHNGIMLFMGGVPSGDNGGVQKFKSRWSNRTVQSWLLRKVIRPDVYQALAMPGNQFFPAYRTNW